ncbi:hypothetical protein MSG28_003642 [Choristoneura fumiferana]|uniref:Uncharacterized protein n=1 Tax=Choristoneura fumiferana TaxID=7141 RepID=A0ACC0KFS3_CHOFU|nr:hypothetical protein MSG28_003642 [Choristoneura fumiferana]
MSCDLRQPRHGDAYFSFGESVRKRGNLKWKPRGRVEFILLYTSSTYRTSNADRNESPEAEGSISPEPPDRPPGKARQIHPEEKTQVLAYDSTYRKKNKPKSLPLEDNQLYNYNHLANTNVAMSPIYPLTPNICVEGGKIEFIKSPPGSARNSVALVSPPQTPLVGRRGSREKRDVRIYDEPTEKFDGDKELLERRIKQLESQLEEEKSKTQRERLSVTKLQNKLIKPSSGLDFSPETMDVGGKRVVSHYQLRFKKETLYFIFSVGACESSPPFFMHPAAAQLDPQD